jgi:hypothetical protein
VCVPEFALRDQRVDRSVKNGFGTARSSAAHRRAGGEKN